MTAKITIIKNYRNKETLRLVELQEVADSICNGEMQEEVSEFRAKWPLMTFVGVDGQSVKIVCQGVRFQKIGNYLNRPEYKFQSKHSTSGNYYWVKVRV